MPREPKPSSAALALRFLVTVQESRSAFDTIRIAAKGQHADHTIMHYLLEQTEEYATTALAGELITYCRRAAEAERRSLMHQMMITEWQVQHG